MEKLIQYLSQFVTPERLKRFEDIIQYRTRYITIGLEDIYQSHNASAVLRTCDCFGLQDVHIIENKNEYKVNDNIALGASNWLSIKKYKDNPNNTLQAIQTIKQAGYRLVATTPHEKYPVTDLEKFDLSKGKFCLFFGTEQDGITSDVIDNADEFLKIPMYGFTESFNISVSTGIMLHHLTYRLRKSKIDWQLSNQESLQTKLEWLRSSIKNCDAIEKIYTEEKNS